MTDMQYHQDNERQGRYTASVQNPASNATYGGTLPSRSLYPQQKRFQLVPAAVICAFVVVGALVFYNYRQTKTDNRASEEVSVSAESVVSTKGPINLAQNATEGTDAEVSDDTVTLPADAKININTGDQTVTIPASRLAANGNEGASVINININPVAESKAGTVQAASPVVKTVQTVQTVPQVVQVPVPNYNYNYVPGTYYYNNYNYGNNNKPYTPYIENCGNFDGGNRWNDAKIVLPKYSRDGKDAVEYEVNVGTSNGGSEVHSHRYEQRDRVVFGVSIDNEREYFVRYRVRMDGGDFGDWSDTFRFVCHRY